MFAQSRPETMAGTAAGTLALIYHTTVRDIRKTHGNAVVALLLNVVQAVLFVLGFWGFFAIMGVERSAIRGDFMLYLMSGVFLYMCHTKTLTAIVASEATGSQLMKHGPMTTAVTISAAALSTLYVQVLTMGVMLFFYHVGFNRIEIDEPAGAFAMMLLSWFSGIGIGMILLALKPWAPAAVGLVASIYSRVSMVASGKMFVANTLPPTLLAMFDWNPLFHAIDQERGFLFVNYTPYFTSVEYPLIVSAAMIVIGMMLEFRTRKAVSASWQAKR